MDKQVIEKTTIIDDIDVSGCESIIEDCQRANNFEGRYDHIKNVCELGERGAEYYNLFCKDNSNCYYKQLKRKEQECRFLKNITALQSKDIHDKKQQLNQLKENNEILEKDKANLDVIIETLKAQFNQLEKENVKLKELVKTRIEDLCDSCGASSMMPMPCKVYEQTLQEIIKICYRAINNEDGYMRMYGGVIANQILEKCEVLKDE